MDVARRTAMQSLAATAGFSGLALPSSRRLTQPVPVARNGGGQAWSVEGLPRPATVASWIKLVNSRFGPQRLTGEENHRGFVDWLDTMFSSAGFSVQRDTYTFQRWAADPEEVSAWAELPGGRDRRVLDVLSPFAYSASTRETEPVIGRAVYVPVGTGTLVQAVAALLAYPPADLAECVVVLESPCQDSPAVTLWGADPHDRTPMALRVNTPLRELNPLVATYTQLAGRCRGLVYCWTNLPDELARRAYAPPSMAPSIATIPAVWVGTATAKLLRALSAQGAVIGIRVDARVHPHAPTDTLIATLPGASDEIMAIGSHTDGVDIIEDNGPLALLALGMQAALLPRARRRRSLALYLATGHFADAALTDPATATGPYGNLGADVTGAWRDHPALVAKTVVALGAEHLGATHSSQPGHGPGPIPVPDYLVTTSGSAELDKFSLDTVYSRITTLAEIVRRLNGLSARQIAAVDPLGASLPATVPPGVPRAARGEGSCTTLLDSASAHALPSP